MSGEITLLFRVPIRREEIQLLTELLCTASSWSALGPLLAPEHGGLVKDGYGEAK